MDSGDMCSVVICVHITTSGVVVRIEIVYFITGIVVYLKVENIDMYNNNVTYKLV